MSGPETDEGQIDEAKEVLEAIQFLLNGYARKEERELGHTEAECREAAQVLQDEAERLKEKEKIERQEKIETMARKIRETSLLLSEINSIATEIQNSIVVVSSANSISSFSGAAGYARARGH